MNTYFIIITIILLISLFLLYLKNKKLSRYIEEQELKIQEQLELSDLSSAKEHLENEIQQYSSRLKEQEKEIVSRDHSIENKKIEEKSLDSQIESKIKMFDIIKEQKKKDLYNALENKRQASILLLKREIADWSRSAQQSATAEFQQLEEAYNEKISEIKGEYEKILEEVSNYKEKRDAINQEILRSRALEEKQDFYQIQLDDQSLRDIELLQQIKPQLSKFEILNKLIYDNYVSKPTKEMVKRVLAGKSPAGIYKVTNIQTKEIYIGKSVAIGERWQNHVKSACGLSGVAESQFQRALKKYGIQNFTWELLEETSKDKLSEREKYYIDFYETTKYGYNERRG